MNKNNHDKKEFSMLEKIKWFFISTLFVLSFLVNNYFYEKQLLIRTFITYFLVICGVMILLSTKKGKNIFHYITKSKKEIQKIIWPSYKESLYTTLIIIIITIIMSLILWALDSIIFHLIEFIISLRF